jgi:hypothetical protein
MAANRLAARFRSPLVVFGIQLRRNVNDEAPHANQADGAEVSRLSAPSPASDSGARAQATVRRLWGV